jgi:hypothetical protein
MQKQKTFYNHRNRHSGQFYARSQYLQDQAAGRLAFTIFILFILAGTFCDVISSLLIK